MHFFFYKREGGSKGGEVEEGGRGERVGCSFCSTQKVHCAVKLYIHIRNVKPSASASWILVTVNKITLPTILSPFFSFHSKKKRERERDRERHREREGERERKPSILFLHKSLIPHDGFFCFFSVSPVFSSNRVV